MIKLFEQECQSTFIFTKVLRNLPLFYIAILLASLMYWMANMFKFLEASLEENLNKVRADFKKITFLFYSHSTVCHKIEVLFFPFFNPKIWPNISEIVPLSLVNHRNDCKKLNMFVN